MHFIYAGSHAVRMPVAELSHYKKLEQRLERKINGLFIIHEIGRALQRTTDLDEILFIVLVGVTSGEALKFNRAFLCLLNEDKTCLEGRMAIGPAGVEEANRIWTDLASKRLTLNDIIRSYREETHNQDTHVNDLVRRIRIPVTDTEHALIRSLTTQTSCLIEEDDVDISMPADFMSFIGARSFAVIPLFSQEQPLGILLADNAITGQPIQDEDVELLEIFAQQASATIDNSYLYETLGRQVRALEQANNNLKTYQEKLIHAERLSAIGEITATVAHEIRNPLVSIGGHARAVRRQMTDSSPQCADLDIIIKEEMRLEGIVTELLDLARPMAIETELHDVNNLMSMCIQMVTDHQAGQRVNIETHFQKDLPNVPLSVDAIKQVMLNLLNNAVEAAGSGDSVLLETSAFNNSFVEIKITDAGDGIPKKDLPRIFDPFFTTKPGGSGLGLTVAKRIIEDHRGTIHVSGGRGNKGTSFIIRMPVQRPETQS